MKFAEETIAFVITPSIHDEIKRLVRRAEPDIKSSHCAEAVARGLGFRTNAALQAAFDPSGSFERSADRLAFEAFLGERGHDVEKLQVDLLPDAVRLATGSRWRMFPKSEPMQVIRGCMTCSDDFWTSGAGNRLCKPCKMRGNRVMGTNNKVRVHARIAEQTFTSGSFSPGWQKLRARPGWADFLDSSEIREEVALLMGEHEQAVAGNFEKLSEFTLSIFLSNGYYETMDELEVSRKAAKRLLDASPMKMMLLGMTDRPADDEDGEDDDESSDGFDW